MPGPNICDRPERAVDDVFSIVDDCWNQIGTSGDGSCPELKEHIHCRNCPVYSAAAVSLLGRDLPEDYCAAWTGYFSEPKQLRESHTCSVVIFRIGGEWLALPTALFTEVAEMRAIHALPHRRNGFLLGVTNIRGELLICVSLGNLLGLEEAASPKGGAAARRLLVMSQEGRRAVFPADEVHGIHRHHTRDLTPAPSTVARSATSYTKAMLSWNDKPVGCLDEQLIFHTLNRRVG